MPSTRTSTRERAHVVFSPATEWHNERTILGVRAPTSHHANDEHLKRERASYEERPTGSPQTTLFVGWFEREGKARREGVGFYFSKEERKAKFKYIFSEV